MDSRKNNLLVKIIEEYTKTAEPVGSKLIAKNPDFNLSSATIRNEMSELEKDGLIFQPHTSAGRQPTEQGFRFYVENFLEEKILPAKIKANLSKKLAGEQRQSLKELAKNLADVSNEGVVLAFSKNDFYYTGLTNLFSQPEFSRHDIVFNLSAVIDHLDETINKIFDNTSDKVEIKIGKANPFGDLTSAIFTKFNSKKYKNGLVGVLGPMRMNYNLNYSLIRFVRDLINNQ